MNHNWIEMEILEIERLTPSFFGIKLIPSGDIGFHFQAGQCVNLLTPSRKKVCISIASEPEEKKFVEFLVKDQPETATHELCQRLTGEKIKMSLPFGSGFPIEQFKQKDLLLIGIGSGLSPLRSLLKSLLRKDHQFQRISLIYGAKNQAEIPFKSEFDFWSKKINVQIALTQPTGVDWRGFKGRVTDLIQNLEMKSKQTICCICGNKEMESEIRNLLERKGISKENILLNY